MPTAPLAKYENMHKKYLTTNRILLFLILCKTPTISKSLISIFLEELEEVSISPCFLLNIVG